MATGKWYGLGARQQWSATAADRVDWVNDTIKVSLHTATYTPDQDAHDYFNDVTNEIAAGSGYTSGGETLASKTLTYDTASNTVRLDAADVTWTFSGSKTFRYAVISKSTGVASTSVLMGYVDFGSDQTTSGTFTLQWDATDGVLRAVVS